MGAEPEPQRAWYDTRGWSLRKNLIVVGCAVAVIVGVVIGAVEGVKFNEYPDYSKLSYTPKDTYSGTESFGNFVYYSVIDRGTHGNAMTLHTSKNCKMNTKRKKTGTEK
jgi:hypothetical protein